jgi:hypothetical protein
MSDKVFAEVGQHSRNSGRTPVHVIADRLRTEREKLLAEKTRIEAKFSELDLQKRDALTKVYRNRIGISKVDACEKTNTIEADYQRARGPLLKEKAAIEERLHDIKNQAASIKTERDDVVVLKRIENLLIRIVNKLQA